MCVLGYRSSVGMDVPTRSSDSGSGFERVDRMTEMCGEEELIKSLDHISIEKNRRHMRMARLQVRTGGAMFLKYDRHRDSAAR